ncbi:MAG: hypothetical protein U0Q16_39740 [Bryobacteraceae bacterium]
MRRTVRCLTLLSLAVSALGADVEGVIRITKRLTRQRVALPATAYQRGVAVPLASTATDDDELSRVAIYLEGIDERETGGPVREIVQRGRQFEPGLLIVPRGATVSFPNQDPIFHNVFSLSKTRPFDLGYFPKGETRTVNFTAPGIVEVYCHLHANMSATVVVTPNRWSARPGADGRFRLTGIPAGDRPVAVWHRSAGLFRKTVHLREGEPAQVEFVIPVDVRVQPEVRR